MIDVHIQICILYNVYVFQKLLQNQEIQVRNFQDDRAESTDWVSS